MNKARSLCWHLSTFDRSKTFADPPLLILRVNFRGGLHHNTALASSPKSTDQLQLKGKAWTHEMTVQEFLKATIGHELHHMKVLNERYAI